MKVDLKVRRSRGEYSTSEPGGAIWTYTFATWTCTLLWTCTECRPHTRQRLSHFRKMCQVGNWAYEVTRPRRRTQHHLLYHRWSVHHDKIWTVAPTRTSSVTRTASISLCDVLYQENTVNIDVQLNSEAMSMTMSGCSTSKTTQQVDVLCMYSQLKGTPSKKYEKSPVLYKRWKTRNHKGGLRKQVQS